MPKSYQEMKSANREAGVAAPTLTNVTPDLVVSAVWALGILMVLRPRVVRITFDYRGSADRDVTVAPITPL